MAKRAPKLQELLKSSERTADQTRKSFLKAEDVLASIEDRERRRSERDRMFPNSCKTPARLRSQVGQTAHEGDVCMMLTNAVDNDVWVTTWARLINEAERRFMFYREQLKYNVPRTRLSSAYVNDTMSYCHRNHQRPKSQPSPAGSQSSRKPRRNSRTVATPCWRSRAFSSSSSGRARNDA